MKGVATVTKRELHAFFVSPVAYAFLVLFLLIAGYFFYRSLTYFSYVSLQAGYDRGASGILNPNEAVLAPLYSNLVFLMLFALPILTMRLFAEEKKSGTLELLMSYPLTVPQIVFGKLLAALSVFALGLVSALLFPVILAVVGSIDWAPVLTAYLGLLLVAAAFCSVGLLFSAMTENQIIAAAATFAVLLGLWAIGWITSFLPGALGMALNQLSIYFHFSEFNRGVLNSNDALFFISLTVYFLFLTIMVLKNRTWKS